MHFIVLFTLFSGLAPALVINENVAFHKAKETTLTRSKEVLGMADIAPHSIEQIYDFSF